MYTYNEIITIFIATHNILTQSEFWNAFIEEKCSNYTLKYEVLMTYIMTVCLHCLQQESACLHLHEIVDIICDNPFEPKGMTTLSNGIIIVQHPASWKSLGAMMQFPDHILRLEKFPIPVYKIFDMCQAYVQIHYSIILYKYLQLNHHDICNSNVLILC
jgi:hypothetical protein